MKKTPIVKVPGIFFRASKVILLSFCIFATSFQVKSNNRYYEQSQQKDMQQRILITGTVTDEEGMTMPGVNILIKGTTKGTVTDSDGKYSIQISSPNDILVFSFMGYTKHEFLVGNQQVIDIVLNEDNQQIEEVVVVGYGTSSKRNVTGSVSKVNMKKMNELPNTNITQALRGSVAGVQVTDNGRPGQGGTILVRGPRSLAASNDPLIVLDGIIYNGSLSNINPMDIQSMEVLKDASAAAIYGSRAANGVILITSKTGITEKPTVNFNAIYGVSDWGYKVKLFDPDRYVQSKADYRQQSGLNIDPNQSYLYASEEKNRLAGITHDPWEMASQDGSLQSYDLSISGQSKRNTYYLSGSYSDEKGLVYNDNQKRISLRANIDIQVTDWLNVGTNASFSQRDQSGVVASLYDAYVGSPFGTWYYPEDRSPTRYVVEEDQVSVNPLYAAKLTDNEKIYQNLFANLYAKINIPYVKGLNFRVNYSPNYRWDHNYNFMKQDSHRTDNNTYASKFNQNNFDWVLENILTYNNRIGEDHGINLTLLYGREHFGWESTTASAKQLTTAALGYNNLELGNVMETKSAASASDGISSMFRLNYTFKDKYLLTLTARRDGSSVFAENNKYATFPSGALAWIISDENFMKSASFVDILKLRASYGAVGNQAISPYQSLSLSKITQYVYNDGGTTSIGIYPSNMGNSDLKWETTYTSNLAVDFTLFKGRIGGTLELYNSNTHDLIVNRAIPVMTGFKSVYTNIGQTNNKGIELLLNTVNIESSKFGWNSSIAFSANRNKIVHLYNSDVDKDGVEDSDIGNGWFIGKPITSYYDYVFDGIYQEGDKIPAGSQPGFVRLKDLDGDGKITTNDRKIVGSGGQPDYRIGFNNDFRYGNVTLSIFINAMLGWTSSFPLLNTAISPNAPGRGLNQLDAGYWTSENKSNIRPSLVYNNPYAHGWYVSRNFIRIQDVSLSYSLPKKINEKLHTSNLKVFASAKNLYTFTDWPGSDPESGGTSADNLYPMPRIISMGLNVSF